MLCSYPLAQAWLTTFSISTERCAWTVFMIYDAIIRRNLLVGPDCFYYLYFLLEIYFLLEYEGSSLPLVRLRDRCSDVGTCTGNPERQGLLTCGLAVRWWERERERERDRQTSALKGFTTDFLVERDEILFVGRYQTHTKKIRMRGQGKGGETGCVLQRLSYISQSAGIGKGLEGTPYPFASNIQITSLKWTSTKISLLLQDGAKPSLFYS